MFQFWWVFTLWHVYSGFKRISFDQVLFKGKQYVYSENPPYTQYAYNLDFSSGIKFAPLKVVSRSEWGKEASRWDPYQPRLEINSIERLKYLNGCRFTPTYTVKQRIIIHHTVTEGVSNQAVQEVYKLHAYKRIFKKRVKVGPNDYILVESDLKGWGDIGYNFLIDKNGAIFEGKIGGPSALGYHSFTSANLTSIGVALIGNFEKRYPTKAQQESLSNLIAYLSAFYGFDINYSKDIDLRDFVNFKTTVLGHKALFKWDWEKNNFIKVPYTQCPGKYTESVLPSIVKRAEVIKDQKYLGLSLLRKHVTQKFKRIKQHSKGDVYSIVVRFTNNNALEQLFEKPPIFYGFSNIERIDDVTIRITVSPICSQTCVCTLPATTWTGYDRCSSNRMCQYNAADNVTARAIELGMLFTLSPHVVWWYAY